MRPTAAAVWTSGPGQADQKAQSGTIKDTFKHTQGYTSSQNLYLLCHHDRLALPSSFFLPSHHTAPRPPGPLPPLPPLT
jgi:hypothetical protein